MKLLLSAILSLVILAMPFGMTGCSSDSKSNPTGPDHHAGDWIPLDEGITAVWDHIDYDEMDMEETYTDTTVAMMKMRGMDMYYMDGAMLAVHSGSPADSICLMMRHDSLFARDFAAVTEPREVLVALFPPRTGSEWNGGWGTMPTRWSRLGQDVTVPAGAFHDVALLQVGPMGADSSYNEFWFAKGTGVIKSAMRVDRMNGDQHNVMMSHSMQLRKITIP